MKKSLPEIPNTFPPYHRITIFIEYIQYLYENIPETSPLIADENMREVHQVFREAYVKIMKAVTNFTNANGDNDDFYNAMPLTELYVVSHRYNEQIIDFEQFKRSWSTREARIDQILSDLE